MSGKLETDRFMQVFQRLYHISAFDDMAQLWQGETRILYYIYYHGEEEINPSELSDFLLVTRARITAALSGLRKKGYVTMEISPQDRRRMTVELTETGRSYVKEKIFLTEQRLKKLRKELGEEDAEQLIFLLEKSIGIFEQELRPAKEE